MPSPSSRLAEIRYTLRSLIDQIVGYCEVVIEHGNLSDQFLAGLNDICVLAKSIAASLEAPKLTSRQVENVGRRTLALTGHIGHRSAELRALAASQGQHETASDLARLHATARSLLPFARELILNHQALAAAGDFGSPAVPPSTRAGDSNESEASQGARLLIVDDNEGNRDLLARRLGRSGLSSIMSAGGGREALDLLRQHRFDLVLLDVMMPDINGIEVLREMKQDAQLRDIPVVMISAVDDVASVAECIELGAEDYLPKPFEQVVLQARIRGSLERKRLRDEEKQHTRELELALQEIDRARRVSEDLLRNILPNAVAEELQEKNAVDPMYFEDVTIVFTDFVQFTAATEALSADELVSLLHQYFTAMDLITERYGLEKLKTIGDSYMFAGGLPVRNPAHPVDAVLAAFEIRDLVRAMRVPGGAGGDWSIRIGVHTGPVIAGVVGVRKFAFDIWGESVNMASRMEAAAIPDTINLSERTYSRIKDFFACERRSKVRIKDGHELDMYTPQAVHPKLLVEAGTPPPAFAQRYRTYFRKELLQFPASLAGSTERI